MNAFRSALFLTALALSTATLANPIRGAGATPCAAYTASLADPAPLAVAKHVQLYQWVLGFLSAYNHYQRGARLTSDPNDNGVFGSDPEALGDALYAYCAANPKRDLYEASQTFILDQERKR